jgi:inosine/xanthosine triphosphate pyrophosphatase family protein
MKQILFATYSEEYKTTDEIIEQGSLEIFNQIHEPIIVEDSIFEVEALNNRPGVDSADYLKKYGSREPNFKAVLEYIQILYS